MKKSYTGSDNTIIPRLIIRPHTVAEEVNYVLGFIERMNQPHLKDYHWEIPHHPVFERLKEGCPREVDMDIYLKAMESVYHDNDYLPGLNNLEKHRKVIESVFPKFSELNHTWGFVVKPNYSICLTRYGPGGSYNAITGKVIILTNSDGSFKHSYPTHTPIHEMVHIGIQEPIVEKFKLSHSEKERLVDKICLALFSNELPGYFIQQLGDPRINEFISSADDIVHLPEVLEKYVQKYPRQPQKNT